MSRNVKELVAENVRKARLSKGLSQSELASRMRADRSYVSRLEAGKQNCTIETLSAVAKILGVKVSDLTIG
jgi:XRE family transcriptional regulator, regulator of sulfur utilization